MRKKKKGVALIIVIIIFMFVCSVSIAMLSMVAGNYTARVSESKRIENLYSSESGIDMAYNIVGKTIGAGIKYGYYQVSELRRKENEGPYQPYYNKLDNDINELEKDINDYEATRKSAQDDNTKRSIDEQIVRCKNGIETDKTTMNDLFKEEFKRAFKIYIQKENADDKIDDETDVLRDSIVNKKYKDVSLTYEDNGAKVDHEKEEVKAKYTEYGVEFPSSSKQTITDEEGKNQELPLLKVIELSINHPEGEKIKIKNRSKDSDYKEKHHSECDVDEELNSFKGEYYNLTIQSEFLSAEENTKVVGKNTRTIEASYKLLVPNYEDVLMESSEGKIKTYSTFKDRGLTIGKNMDVSDVNNFTVKGDLFVQGYNDLGKDYGKVYDKYEGGIKINNSKTVKFEPVNLGVEVNDKTVNVNTRGTFNILNNSKVIIGSDNFDKNPSVEGNLYAANIYAGDITRSSEFTDGSSLIVNNNVVTDNDLVVKATSTDLKMRNFYGINDKNIQYDKNNDNTNEIEKTSSSIIINGHKDANGNGKSNVQITDNAYIMGVAQIDTDGNYQTGESIAVKGNYTAYAVPVSPKEAFKYDSQLQVLADQKDKEVKDDIFDKAKHFEDYWNGNGQDSKGKNSNEKEGIQLSNSKADNGGIILPDNTDNIHSIGAIVYKMTTSSGQEQTGVRKSKYIIEDEQEGGEVYKKREEYAKQVYDLGVDPDHIKMYSDHEANADTVKDILTDLIKEKLPNTYDWNAELKFGKDGNEVSIFNPTKDPIVIDGDQLKDHKMRAVIVTKGDVEIKGDVTFQGNIITEGNLTVHNGSNVTIQYDKDIVNDMQDNEDKNYADLFQAVFGQAEVITKQDTESDDKTLLKEVLDGQYDIKKYLVNKLWKLIQ